MSDHISAMSGSCIMLCTSLIAAAGNLTDCLSCCNGLSCPVRHILLVAERRCCMWLLHELLNASNMTVQKWSILTMLQVFACVNILLGIVDYAPIGHASSPRASANSSRSAHYDAACQSSPFSTASRLTAGHTQDSIQSPVAFQSSQQTAAWPVHVYSPLLETATSLSSVNTTT